MSTFLQTATSTEEEQVESFEEEQVESFEENREYWCIEEVYEYFIENDLPGTRHDVEQIVKCIKRLMKQWSM